MTMWDRVAWLLIEWVASDEPALRVLGRHVRRASTGHPSVSPVDGSEDAFVTADGQVREYTEELLRMSREGAPRELWEAVQGVLRARETGLRAKYRRRTPAAAGPSDPISLGAAIAQDYEDLHGPEDAG